MSLVLTRVDDRLIHGQVVVGWANSLRASRIVLVDDRIRASEWEQELLAEGAEGLEVAFLSVKEAASTFASFANDGVRTILLMGTVASLEDLLNAGVLLGDVNLGGIHDQLGRESYLPYLFLDDSEVESLRRISGLGVRVSAADTPASRRVELEELI